MLVLPLFLVAPVAILAWASLLPYYTPPSADSFGALTVTNYARALATPNIQASVRTSSIAAVASAFVVAVLALLNSWSVARTPGRISGFVDFLASVPLVFPGIVLGLAVMQMFLTLRLPLYGTVGILIFAFVVRYMPYGMRYAHPAVIAINTELEEAARVAGAGTLTVLRRVIVPLTLPGLGALWIYVVLISIRELSLSVMLSGAQTPVVALVVLSLWQTGEVPLVAAFSCVLVVVLTTLGLAFLQLSRRYGFHG